MQKTWCWPLSHSASWNLWHLWMPTGECCTWQVFQVHASGIETGSTGTCTQPFGPNFPLLQWCRHAHVATHPNIDCVLQLIKYVLYYYSLFPPTTAMHTAPQHKFSTTTMTHANVHGCLPPHVLGILCLFYFISYVLYYHYSPLPLICLPHDMSGPSAQISCTHSCLTHVYI